MVYIALGIILIILSSVIKKQDGIIKELDKEKNDDYMRGYKAGYEECKEDILKESGIINESDI